MTVPGHSLTHGEPKGTALPLMAPSNFQTLAQWGPRGTRSSEMPCRATHRGTRAQLWVALGTKAPGGSGNSWEALGPWFTPITVPAMGRQHRRRSRWGTLGKTDLWPHPKHTSHRRVEEAGPQSWTEQPGWGRVTLHPHSSHRPRDPRQDQVPLRPHTSRRPTDPGSDEDGAKSLYIPTLPADPGTQGVTRMGPSHSTFPCFPANPGTQGGDGQALPSLEHREISGGDRTEGTAPGWPLARILPPESTHPPLHKKKAQPGGLESSSALNTWVSHQHKSLGKLQIPVCKQPPLFLGLKHSLAGLPRTRAPHTHTQGSPEKGGGPLRT